MTKRLICFMLSFAIFLAAAFMPCAAGAAGEASAAGAGEAGAARVRGMVRATPTTSPVYIDGAKVEFESYNVEDFNYFKLRDLAYALSGSASQFDVGWDEAGDTITLTSSRPYKAAGGEMSAAATNINSVTAMISISKIYIDGKESHFSAYTIDGYNYFRLRDIGAAIGFGVSWDAASDTININTSVSNDWAAAYKGVIDKLTSQYGDAGIFYHDLTGYCLNGLCIVRLIDFDGDGTYELYCAYNDDPEWPHYKQIIYGYDKYAGGLVLLMDEKRVSNPGTDVDPRTRFLYKNNITYMDYMYEWTDIDFYTIVHGEMVSVLSMYYDAWDDINHTING